MSNVEFSVSSAETSAILRTLQVEVHIEGVQQAFDRAYRELARTARLPGFRPGKAPRKVLERRYGPDVATQIGRQLVEETLLEATRRSELRPVAEPEVDADPAQPNAVFRYSARVEVRPPITLPKLKRIKVARTAPQPVEDADIDREIEELRGRLATLEELEADAAAQRGHYLTVDYQGRIDDEPFPGGAAEDALVELGAGRLLPELEEALVGALVGAALTVDATFPEDYPAEELRGKSAVFDMTVKRIARRELPEPDDAFARRVSGSEDVDLAGLRALVGERLEQEKAQSSKRALHSALFDALLEKTAFELPPGMVHGRLNQRLQNAYRQFASYLPREKLQELVLRWQQEWLPEVERSVRESLLLDAVVEQQAIDVEAQEVDARLTALAQAEGVSPQRLREPGTGQGLQQALKQELGREKALAWLLEQVKIIEKSKA